MPKYTYSFSDFIPTSKVSHKSRKSSNKVGIKYYCDEDYIEVPGGTESVTWTDEDGQSYEINISDLQEYDGEDGEIKYTKPNQPYVKMDLQSSKNLSMINAATILGRFSSRIR